MPRNIVGPPVEGEDCFGRDDFVLELESRVELGSVLVLAPRRWGKTSVLRSLRDRNPSTRHYFDLYPLERASDFVAEVAASTAGPVARVREWVGSILGRSLDRVREIRIAEVAVELRERLASSTNWQRSAAGLFRAFPAGHVLVFDEFPVMAKAILDRDKAEATALLRWLRAERQRDEAPHFVFAGSTSLPELCRQASLSDTINDLELLPLPRFDQDTASALMRGLFETAGVAIEPASLRAALDLVGAEVPFFIQVLTHAVLAEVRDSDTRVTTSLVRRIYRDVLLSADSRAYLDDFRGRLDRSYLPSEREVAVAVLNALSREREGLDLVGLTNEVIAKGADERLVERVIALLEGDFYVSRDAEGRYRFLNRYLADWWERFNA